MSTFLRRCNQINLFCLDFSHTHFNKARKKCTYFIYPLVTESGEFALVLNVSFNSSTVEPMAQQMYQCLEHRFVEISSFFFKQNQPIFVGFLLFFFERMWILNFMIVLYHRINRKITNQDNRLSKKLTANTKKNERTIIWIAHRKYHSVQCCICYMIWHSRGGFQRPKITTNGHMQRDKPS